MRCRTNTAREDTLYTLYIPQNGPTRGNSWKNEATDIKREADQRQDDDDGLIYFGRGPDSPAGWVVGDWRLEIHDWRTGNQNRSGIGIQNRY